VREYDANTMTMLTNKPLILNNSMNWDGSHLGFYKGVITNQWSLEGTHYYGITLPQGWSTKHPPGIIYCNASQVKDSFPCIVEDLKEVFGLPRRGVNRINIDGREYVLYYVPISNKGEVIWETPLNRLGSKHPLRSDPNFKRNVQRIIAFCDILALSSTGEPAIRIRPGVDGGYIPIGINETHTTIYKADRYDYSVLTKTLFSKWFGEETAISEIVYEIVGYRSVTNKRMITMDGEKDLVIISTDIRNKVDDIIKRYNSDYIWYSSFIVDRMSRYLLVDQ
jgi:hypothetical protein